MSEKPYEYLIFCRGIRDCLKNFVKDANIQEKELPNTLKPLEIDYVHQTAKSLGLLSRIGENRKITIYKKSSMSYLKDTPKINLTEKSKIALQVKIRQNPLTRQDRNDLKPSKVDICRSIGKLASGIPQVPIKSEVKPMISNYSEEILNTLSSPQQVILLKCGPDPRSRLLVLSQILLNDANERGQKIKVRHEQYGVQPPRILP